MFTYLITGLALLATLASVVNMYELARYLVRVSAASDIFTLFALFALLFLALPFGYAVTMVWKSLSNLVCDPHRSMGQNIRYTLQEISDLKETKFSWRRALRNEVFLALFHRGTYDGDFGSWHEERLERYHRSGSVMLGVLFGVVLSLIVIKYYGELAYVVPSVGGYLAARWFFLALLVVFFAFNILRMVRSYEMIQLFNRLTQLTNFERLIQEYLHTTRIEKEEDEEQRFIDEYMKQTVLLEKREKGDATETGSVRPEAADSDTFG